MGSRIVILAASILLLAVASLVFLRVCEEGGSKIL